MIPDQQFYRLVKASERTKDQLGTIEELEGSIDEKFTAVIRQVVVKEIDATIQELRKFDPTVDLDNPTRKAGVYFSTETWITLYKNGEMYQFFVETMEAGFFRRQAIRGERNTARLPVQVFMKIINDLKINIIKGELDQRLHLKSDSFIYERMKQVEETLIPEWMKQGDPSYMRQKHLAEFMDKIGAYAKSTLESKEADKSQQTQK